MSRENAEIARRGIEQLNRAVGAEKFDLSLFTPGVVVDNSNAVFDGTVYRGHDGVREWLSWAQGMWKRQQLEPEQFIPVDEDRVIVPVRIVSVGRDDVEVVARAAALVTVDEGKIAHMKTFQARGEALLAVGLSEQPPAPN